MKRRAGRADKRAAWRAAKDRRDFVGGSVCLVMPWKPVFFYIACKHIRLKDKLDQNLPHRFLFPPVITKNGGEAISKESHSDCRLDQRGDLCYMFSVSSQEKDCFQG